MIATAGQIELEFGFVGFWGEEKTGVPVENLSEQGREPTTNLPTIVLYAFKIKRATTLTTTHNDSLFQSQV